MQNVLEMEKMLGKKRTYLILTTVLLECLFCEHQTYANFVCLINLQIKSAKPKMITIAKYRIYLIKRPGFYFLAASVEGAFKRDGRLFETGVYCFVYFKLLLISSYYALFGCYHSSQLLNQS